MLCCGGLLLPRRPTPAHGGNALPEGPGDAWRGSVPRSGPGVLPPRGEGRPRRGGAAVRGGCGAGGHGRLGVRATRGRGAVAGDGPGRSGGERPPIQLSEVAEPSYAAGATAAYDHQESVPAGLLALLGSMNGPEDLAERHDDDIRERMRERFGDSA